MNELVPKDDLTYEIGETTETSWQAPADMTYEQWERIGRTLQQLGRSLNWWIGDWLNEGEQKWGEMYAQALELTGLSLETLSKYKRVAARVPASVRLPGLSWTHHFSVAYAEEAHRGPLLQIAAHYSLSSRDLKEIIRLKTEHQAHLINTYLDDPTLPVLEFSRRLNALRLDGPTETMVGASASHRPQQIRAFEAETSASDETLYDEDIPFPAHSHGEDGEVLPLYEEVDTEPVFVEQIFEFFDKSGTPLDHLLSNEVSWGGGLLAKAVLDTKGKPILVWERSDAVNKE